MLPASSSPEKLGGEPGRHRVADADHAQELLHVPGQAGEDLADEVVGHAAIRPGELREEGVAVAGLPHTERGEPQPGGPAAGAPVQHPQLRLREVQPRLLHQGRRLGPGEAQLRRAQLA
ncbi:hypothetical protein [Pseudonocardia sp. T1-2H]|uniref:hypothetical protein n=1 Tax=Pseudonocardia sp. T1-2H TaxID=3128899 RepID=UPI003100E3EA